MGKIVPWLALTLLLSISCDKNKPRGSQPGPTPVSTAPMPTPPEPTTPVPAGWVGFLLSETADLDGDGKNDRIEIQCKRPANNAKNLAPGAKCHLQYEADAVEDGKPTGADQLKLVVNRTTVFSIESPNLSLDPSKQVVERFGFAVVDITPTTPDKQIVLKLGCDEYECEYDNTYLLRFDGKAIEELWNQGLQELRWQSDGSWIVANRECYAENKMAYRTRRHAWDGTQVVTGKAKVEVRDEECMPRGRCPYVYAGDSYEYMGEVLPNFVGRRAWNDSAIVIPRRLVNSGILRIRIAEEKLGETSYIDNIWLTVGDRVRKPQSCAARWCGGDRKLHALRLGDSIELAFADIPATGEIKLWVNGYYELHQ